MVQTQDMAVLTGDLIDSQKLPAAIVSRAMETLAQVAADFTPEGRKAAFNRFRGDGWQMLVPDATRALDATLAVIAALRTDEHLPATRIGIGIGSGPAPEGDIDLSAMSGPAFVASGRALDAMPRRSRLAIAGEPVGPWHEAVIALVDHVAQGWTAAQAEAIAHWLRAPDATQDDIAAPLGITRQAVQARLAAAGAASLQTSRAAFATLGAS